MPAFGRGNIPAFGLATNAVRLHEQSDTFLAHPQAATTQLVIDARPAIFLLHLAVNGSDMYKQSLIGNRADPGTFPERCQP
ncbi:hypothetical protein SAMN04488135_109129 [Pollutimonas bauzanensis]|uniref:Uncharacterized protein n=1 Tax=Pollutimonas bauzanensis TaxID=658167 RepID=A0A1M5YIH4_9BURK|nr:hypothetical protein SAMN04488135_109129 [Pollutimonas bauzanensis]